MIINRYTCPNCGRDFGHLLDIKSDGVFDDTQVESYICEHTGWIYNGCGHIYKIRTNKNTDEIIEYVSK